MSSAPFAQLSHPGGVAEVNEDLLLHLPSVPLYAVIDGSGGPGLGDFAAGVVAEALGPFEEDLAALRAAVVAGAEGGQAALDAALELAVATADRSLDDAANFAGHRRIGASLVLAVHAGNQATIAHVGNCRAYLLRGVDRIKRLTEDHTVEAMRARTRSSSIDGEGDGRLFQMLGQGRGLEVDIAHVELGDGDVLLLASDGLTDPLDNERLRALVDPLQLEASAKRLVGEAIARTATGHSDNLSVMLVRNQGGRTIAELNARSALLSSAFLFADLSDAERARLAPFLRERTYGAGTVVCQEGAAADGFYLVYRGQADIIRGPMHLATLGPGDHFGENALTGARPRNASVRAQSDLHLFELSRDHFAELATRQPDLAIHLGLRLMAAIGDRLSQANDRMTLANMAARGMLARGDTPTVDLVQQALSGELDLGGSD